MSQELNKDMSQYFYRASAADFMKIPGSPISYWVGVKVLNIFDKEKSLGELFVSRKGMVTANNERYVREWHEISLKKIFFDCKSNNQATESQLKWYPYLKGGDYRKWYGNHDNVVNWEHGGLELRSNRHPKEDRVHATNFNLDHIFQKGITWSDITTNSLSFRLTPEGFIFDAKSPTVFGISDEPSVLGALNSKLIDFLSRVINPTVSFQVGNFNSLPNLQTNELSQISVVKRLVQLFKDDWNSFETSWCFSCDPLIPAASVNVKLSCHFKKLRKRWAEVVQEARYLEHTNNQILIEAYSLQDELIPDVPLEEITLTCNPHYRYGGNRSVEELETLLQCDTLRELVSYAIGCMMGRYSLDKPGLILASQGETLQDYLRQTPSPRFTPDDDAILPLTDQEWFADDATNRFREFIRVVWGDEHLQENLDFVAESLCLHAIKPPSTRSGGESALDTIRRYLSTQFFKDHLRTYKKRPIYWLFSSGKHKAFECLVYLHRYNEGTLARMRTEYVIPLSAKLNSYAEKLEQDRDASPSAAETKRLTNELTTLHKQQAELAEFDEKLRHYADQRISLDLDDGVKVNYGKFGDLLAEVKAVTGDQRGLK